MSANAKAKAIGAKSNSTKKSLVKVVMPEDKGKWIGPEKGSTHHIGDDATFPKITFQAETDAKGPYKWSWKISWEAKVSGLSESGRRGSKVGSFSDKGATETAEPKWQCEAPRRFVWKPTATIGGGRSAVWACGQVAERLVHMPMRPCSA